MNHGKFILAGEDRKVLSGIKKTLVSNGYIFIGYSRESVHLLRNIRSCQPDLVIVDIGNGFMEFNHTLEVMDEEMLVPCILLLESRNTEAISFLRKSKVMTYIAKPVFDESVIQMADITIMNYQRVIEYEQKVKRLNESLESRKIVEKAKWILVEQEGHTEATAYEVIKKKSRDNRIPMRDIAEAIILTRG